MFAYQRVGVEPRAWLLFQITLLYLNTIPATPTHLTRWYNDERLSRSLSHTHIHKHGSGVVEAICSIKLPDSTCPLRVRE